MADTAPNIADAQLSDRIELGGWRTCVVTFPGYPPVLLWHDDVVGLSDEAVIALAAERVDVPIGDDETDCIEYEYILLKHGLNPDGSEADEMLVNSELRASGNGGPMNDVGVLSVEQMCRNLLQYAIHEGFVSPTDEYEDADMTGLANVLASYFRDKPRRE